MSNRKEHLFQFGSHDIARAAKDEAEYHEARERFWQAEMDAAYEIVSATAGVTIQKRIITGGWQPDVVVNYGDPAAYNRMQEAARKIQAHREKAEVFRTHERLYGTQGTATSGRVYELDSEDVHFYRLGGGPRED